MSALGKQVQMRQGKGQVGWDGRLSILLRAAHGHEELDTLPGPKKACCTSLLGPHGLLGTGPGRVRPAPAPAQPVRTATLPGPKPGRQVCRGNSNFTKKPFLE